MVVQAEVNGRIDAAVEESQAAGDDEAEFEWPFTSHSCVGELVHCAYGFEDIVGKPRQDECNYYRQDHFERVSPSCFSPGVGSCNAVSVQMDNNGAIAEDDDQNGKNKCKQSHEEGQTEKKSGFVVVHAEWVTVKIVEFAIYKWWDAKEERGKPYHNASYIDTSAASEVPRVHEFDHSDVSVHTHASQKKHIGVTIDSDYIAAQLAQTAAALPEFPRVILPGRDGPQRQSENENQIGQSQINNERIHETPTSLVPAADHANDKKIAQNSREKYQIVKNG